MSTKVFLLSLNTYLMNSPLQISGFEFQSNHFLKHLICHIIIVIIIMIDLVVNFSVLDV